MRSLALIWHLSRMAVFALLFEWLEPDQRPFSYRFDRVTAPAGDVRVPSREREGTLRIVVEHQARPALRCVTGAARGVHARKELSEMGVLVTISTCGREVCILCHRNSTHHGGPVTFSAGSVAVPAAQIKARRRMVVVGDSPCRCRMASFTPFLPGSGELAGMGITMTGLAVHIREMKHVLHSVLRTMACPAEDCLMGPCKLEACSVMQFMRKRRRGEAVDRMACGAIVLVLCQELTLVVVRMALGAGPHRSATRLAGPLSMTLFALHGCMASPEGEPR